MGIDQENPTYTQTSSINESAFLNVPTNENSKMLKYFYWISIQVRKHHFIIRAILSIILGFYFYIIYSLFQYLGYEISPQGTFPLLTVIIAGIIVVPAIFCHLILVRIDAGHWSFIHPYISVALKELKKNRGFCIILGIVNISIVVMIGFLYTSGFFFSKFGLQSLGLFFFHAGFVFTWLHSSI